MTAKLLFASGFENGVNLAGAQGGTQSLTGTDSSTGFTWPPDLWGGGAALQLLDGSFVNQIQTVIGHDGAPTHALYQSVTGAGGGDVQDPLIFTPNASLGQEGDLYTSEWVKFQPDLASQLFPGQDSSGSWGNWRALFEWKTGGQGADFGGDYRIKVGVGMDDGGHLFWTSAGDNNANGPYPFQSFWQTDNHTVPVAAGQWFHFETFTHRSAGAGGEFWAKVDGQTIVDHQGPNIGVHGDPINRIMLAQDYTGGHLPASQWVDDVQLWDGAPLSGAGSTSTSSGNPVQNLTGPSTPSGQQTIVLHVAEDAWQGNAQFTVTVDGKEVGGVHTATASHAAGQWQDVAVTGNFGASGPSQVTVNYINDASGGAVGSDRNLYVQGLDANGHHFAGASATNSAALGDVDPASAHMVINGSATFHLFF